MQFHNFPMFQDSVSLKEHLLANSHRSIRIANQQELQQRHQRKQQKIAARRNSGGESGCEDQPSNQILSNSPSPRSKHNRKQAKGRTKSIPSTTSETSTSSTVQHSTLSSASFLMPKMQAEQGSIGELQKYHSRYLKNRRHTLANVR